MGFYRWRLTSNVQTADNQNEIAKYLEKYNFQILRSSEPDILVNAIKTVIDAKYYSDTLSNIDTVLKGEWK